MPMVPWPAITSGSSNGCTKVRPSFFSSSRAWVAASSKVSPTSTTSPPRAFTAATLTAGVVTGITITARAPMRLAASATPWAWFPADAQITPASSASRDRWAILL